MTTQRKSLSFCRNICLTGGPFALTCGLLERPFALICSFLQEGPNAFHITNSAKIKHPVKQPMAAAFRDTSKGQAAARINALARVRALLAQAKRNEHRVRNSKDPWEAVTGSVFLRYPLPLRTGVTLLPRQHATSHKGLPCCSCSNLEV